MSHTSFNEKEGQAANRLDLYGQNSFVQGTSGIPWVLKEDARPSIPINWSRNHANATHAIYHFVLGNPIVVNWAMINLKNARTVRKTSAPIWLHKRMEALRRMPPPTLKESLSQWSALGEARRKLGHKPEV